MFSEVFNFLWIVIKLLRTSFVIQKSKVGLTSYTELKRLLKNREEWRVHIQL
jgi:hypothetical protein